MDYMNQDKCTIFDLYMIVNSNINYTYTNVKYIYDWTQLVMYGIERIAVL